MTLKKQVGLHGDRAYISNEGFLVGRGGVASGGEGKPTIIFPSADYAAFFEDFLSQRTGVGGGSAAGLYMITQKSDTGYAASINVDLVGGAFRINTSETPGTSAPSNIAAGICGERKCWKPNRGPGGLGGKLRFAARVKMSTYASATGTAGVYMGFTDTAGSELPAYDTGRGGDSGASAVTVASNFVGFLWGSGGDTGWRGVSGRLAGGNDSGDQQVTLTTTAPPSGEYHTYEIEIFTGLGDTGGTATFYIDGQALGSIGRGSTGRSPCQTNTLLTPCLYVYDTGGASSLDVDWVNVSMPRDSGN